MDTTYWGVNFMFRMAISDRMGDKIGSSGELPPIELKRRYQQALEINKIRKTQLRMLLISKREIELERERVGEEKRRGWGAT